MNIYVKVYCYTDWKSPCMCMEQKTELKPQAARQSQSGVSHQTSYITVFLLRHIFLLWKEPLQALIK